MLIEPAVKASLDIGGCRWLRSEIVAQLLRQSVAIRANILAPFFGKFHHMDMFGIFERGLLGKAACAVRGVWVRCCRVRLWRQLSAAAPAQTADDRASSHDRTMSARSLL